MSSRTLVLDIGQERPQLLVDIEAALTDVNRTVGTAFTSAGIEQTDNSRYTQWVDCSTDAESWLRLADDAKVPALYLELVVPSALLRDKLSDALATRLKVLTCGQLKRSTREATEFKPGPVAWLGLACQGPYDSEVAETIEKALASRDPAIRNNALLATLLLEWKPLLPAIESAARTETVTELKKRFDYIAGMLRGLSS